MYIFLSDKKKQKFNFLQSVFNLIYFRKIFNSTIHYEQSNTIALEIIKHELVR